MSCWRPPSRRGPISPLCWRYVSWGSWRPGWSAASGGHRVAAERGSCRMATSEEKFSQAARCYLGYGLVYWLGGAYLAAQGIGAGSGLMWVALGAVFVVLFPWLIARGARGPGYLWFARLLTLAVAWRAVMVGRAGGAARLPS